MIRAQEEERKALARELDDDPGQRLTALHGDLSSGVLRV
jgi:signal transduction histidine kinase